MINGNFLGATRALRSSAALEALQGRQRQQRQQEYDLIEVPVVAVVPVVPVALGEALPPYPYSAVQNRDFEPPGPTLIVIARVHRGQWPK